MKRIPNMTVEELRERARVLLEESEQIIERARQIEAKTQALVEPEAERQYQRVHRKFTPA